MFQIFRKQPGSIDKQMVKEAAEALMSQHGATTTLEVKNWLRHNNFIAYQWEVSALMDTLAEEEAWAFQWIGKFRVYFIPKPSDIMAALGVPAFSFN